MKCFEERRDELSQWPVGTAGSEDGRKRTVRNDENAIFLVGHAQIFCEGPLFVIAGLMDNRVTNVANKIPGLGDIPILGNFFKSKSLQKSNSELMVLCTARRISPSAEAPKGPPMPVPNMDITKFDAKRP